MKIEKDKWVAIHYTLKDDDGNVIDSSAGGAPLGYVHGNGYLIFGLENELNGREVGDKFSCKIAPADGYGEYDSQLVMDVDRSQFEFDGTIEPGMQFQAMSPRGPILFTVKEVSEDKVKVDGNHDLAGKNLNFDVEVVEVREPTEEELNPTGCGGGCGGCCGEEGSCDCDGDCGSGCGGCH